MPTQKGVGIRAAGGLKTLKGESLFVNRQRIEDVKRESLFANRQIDYSEFSLRLRLPFTFND